MRWPPFLRPWHVLLLCAAWPGTAWAAGVHLRIAPAAATVAPGDTFLVELQIFQADDSFNAFDINLAFDPSRLTFVTTSPVSNQRGPLMTDACPNTFHIFTPASNELRITLSLLCADTFVTGPGVIYRVKFRANAGLGPTNLVCNAGTQFFRAGFYVSPLECLSATVLIDDGTVGVDPDAVAPPPAPWLDPPSPNPWSAPGLPRFTFMLPRARPVSLEVFDVAGRLVARRPESAAAAGLNIVAWDPGALASGAYVVQLDAGAGGTARARWVVVR